MHPSHSRRNLIRTLNVVLAGLDMKGAEFFPDGDERVPPLDCPAWVRASLVDAGARHAGRIAGAHATRKNQLLLIECWVRGNSASDLSTVDRVEEIAEIITSRFRYVSVPLLDYVTSSDAPDPVEGASLRFLLPPTVQRLEPTEGFQRRLVTCAFTLFSREE